MNFSPAPAATLIIETTKTPPPVGRRASFIWPRRQNAEMATSFQADDGRQEHRARKAGGGGVWGGEALTLCCIRVQAGLWNAGVDGVEAGEVRREH